MIESITKRLQSVGVWMLGATLSGLVLVPVAAPAQKYTPPPPPLTSEPCKPTKKDPCLQPPPAATTPSAADAHPFPGEPPSSAADDHAFPGEPAADQSHADASHPATQPDGTSVSPADAASSHPFPGEPDSGSSSSSSSGNSPDAASVPDTSKPALKDEGSSGSTRFQRKHLPKLEDKDRREEQDLEVAKYYASTGDFNASYLRAKDAVATIGDDPEGHFLLAQAAAHLKKTEEARAEYQHYLQLDPEGQHVGAAQKALDLMSPK